MKNVFVWIIILALGFTGYRYFTNKAHQADSLKQQLAKLEKENADLANKNKQALTVVDQDASAHAKRMAELQKKLDGETLKLAAFQKRRDLLSSAINDPAQASTMGEEENEIKEKNEAIQSLTLQLNNNQDYEKMVDHGGEQAKQYQNLNKAQAMADLNTRIRTQQAMIQSTADAIKQNNIIATGDSVAAAQALVPVLAQQKYDLETLRRQRDQINVTNAAATVQIHEQMGYEKTSIHGSEQEIRAQINQLRGEIKALQSQNNGNAKTTSQLKQQASYVDQQIATEKSEIARIQGLINLEK